MGQASALSCQRVRRPGRRTKESPPDTLEGGRRGQSSTEEVKASCLSGKRRETGFSPLVIGPRINLLATHRLKTSASSCEGRRRGEAAGDSNDGVLEGETER